MTLPFHSNSHSFCSLLVSFFRCGVCCWFFYVTLANSTVMSIPASLRESDFSCFCCFGLCATSPLYSFSFFCFLTARWLCACVFCFYLISLRPKQLKEYFFFVCLFSALVNIICNLFTRKVFFSFNFLVRFKYSRNFAWRRVWFFRIFLFSYLFIFVSVRFSPVFCEILSFFLRKQ